MIPMDIEYARKRSELYQRVRGFFNTREYLEVETPILSETLIPESTISCFSTQFRSDFHTSRDYYLIPSPEVHMKRLIGEGYGNIYQIAKCFRNAEQLGSHHNPEFSMLEWYTMDADYRDSISLTEELIQALVAEDTPRFVSNPFEVMTVAVAFKRYTHLDLETLLRPSQMREAIRQLGLSDSSAHANWEEMFNRIFLTFIEPELDRDHPVVLTDYPKALQCLAKPIKGSPYRERWELYIGGIEIANCYTEMTGATDVEHYFSDEYAQLCTLRAESGETIPDIDDSYHEIFTTDYPSCSGVAIGLDRLLMAIHSIKTIQGVILFPFSDTIGRR